LPPASGRRAVFFDRDGVLNPLYAYMQWGLDSPARPEHLTLYADAAQAIRDVRASGFLALLASNQPGIAKSKYSLSAFKRIDGRLTALLHRGGAYLDGRFYCLHHPAATVEAYRAECDCRKPKPGLLLAAAKQFDLELQHCFFIGDSESDILAAQAAGCQPVLIRREGAGAADQWAKHHPVSVVSGLREAVDSICSGGETNVA
jgi:D-glycero-D-manno-heptose 1,7-bisphosphate phosphatase